MNNDHNIKVNLLISGESLVKRLEKLIMEHNFHSTPIFIVDLDGTLFDNYPRQLEIYRKLENQFPQIRHIIPDEELFLNPPPYNLLSLIEKNLVRIHYSNIKTLMKKVSREFLKMFLSNQFLQQDTPFLGAAAVLQEISKMGINIWYLTGRSQRTMKNGTLMSLRTAGFPLPVKNSTVSLIMKPTKKMTDKSFRNIVFNSIPLNKRDSILGYLDNEAELCQLALNFFPSALIIHFQSTQANNIRFIGLSMNQWASIY